MDQELTFAHLHASSPSLPQPLQVRKQESGNDVSINQQQFSDRNPYRCKPSAGNSVFPPRTSSLSSGSPSSSAIIGDFVALNSKNMDDPPQSNVGVNAFSKEHAIHYAANPYEFEPESPYMPQTTYKAPTAADSTWTESQRLPTSPSPRKGHMKSSHSEGNGIDVKRRSYPHTGGSHLLEVPKKASGNALHRSESSPNISPLHGFPTREAKGTVDCDYPDLSSYYAEDEESSSSPVRRGRRPSGGKIRHGNHHHRGFEYDRPSSPIRQASRAELQDYRSQSPGQQAYQDEDGFANTSSRARHPPRSPIRNLEDVLERDETGHLSMGRPTSFSSSPLQTPPKRSRSPMKKMFGEHGWLGQSVDENFEAQEVRKEIAASGQKKITMMGKIKNKLGEIAEKADLSPARSSRYDRDRHPKLSMLSVSLGPPEQARIYMEVELMLVHTGNSYLMNQFRQGRIAVDSIKKTVDFWQSKGRPIVIEFMYDQETQRGLVAVNQHNFRFHGDRAGDERRISSMLYNWKQVAASMSIRTFCNPDTVILKLLFDVEQILELLGASEAILLRLQQIRASVNEMMRISREKQAHASTNSGTSNGRERTWGSRTSAESQRNHSLEDPYGSMRTIPDFFKD